MKANNGYRKPTGAELRAQRIAREVQASPAEEALRHEKLMLSSFVAATASLEWLGTHEGWKLLGFDTCAEWWGARVQPVVEALGLAPTKELGQKVIGLIRAEEAALPRAQQRSARELAALVGVSEWTARTPTPRSQSARNHERDDLDETSAAGPAANPEDASAVLGEPVEVEQPSTGTGPEPDGTGLGSGPQTAADGADTTEADGAEVDGTTAGQAFRSGDAPAPDGDAAPSSSGVTPQDLADEEAVEPPADLPAAAATSLPDGAGNPKPEQSQQLGHNSPTGVEGPRSETDSPTGLEAVQPHADRSETDHHTSAGVSGVGEAPEVGTTASVELEELEGGDAAVTPSSSDPEVDAGEQLLLAFAELVHYLDGVDFDAVGPMLRSADVEALHSHVEAISAYVVRLGRSRFAEMLHTP